MQDQWYGDKRDLVKWGTLLELAHRYHAKQILQVLYYRSNAWNRKERKHEWEQIEIDGKKVDISAEVIQHFRDVNLIRNLKSSVPIEVLNEEFRDENRSQYHQYVVEAIKTRKYSPGIVFLDPDTGLEPPRSTPGPTHVHENELRAIWDSLTAGDVLVFYQHETNRNGDPFIDPKIQQFANAIGIGIKHAKYAYAPKIARDVVFFFAQKATGD